MKTLLNLLSLIILVITLNSCAVMQQMNEDYYNSANYAYRNPEVTVQELGKPDDISKYDADGIHSLTYTYYCYARKYIVLEYRYYGKGYNLESMYTSEGICNK